MNKNERIMLEKQGIDKETIEKLNLYDKPCTILEVVKLSRSVSEDVVYGALDDYRKRSSSTIIALAIQVEILKSILVNKNIIDQEEFQFLYEKEAKEFEEKQKDYVHNMMEKKKIKEEVNSDVSFTTNVNPVEVNIIKD